MLYFDNVYYLLYVQIGVCVCCMNLLLNIVFCGFGGLQVMVVVEYVMEEIVVVFEFDFFDVCKVNFYDEEVDVMGCEERCNVMFYGQVIEDDFVFEMMEWFEWLLDYWV